MTPTAEPAQGNHRATYREVLAEPRFRLLFSTRTVAITADALRITTFSVLVFSATGSPLLSALAFGIGFIRSCSARCCWAHWPTDCRPARSSPAATP